VWHVNGTQSSVFVDSCARPPLSLRRRRAYTRRVSACPACGRDLPPGEFPFCPFCRAPLTEAPPAREQRKTVTVLFCDVTGSTELGESLDPEALRALLAQYFDRMKAIVERHGGSVEKFIGDAVMAVFGVPVLHEDDALRAVTAAVEMREAFSDLAVDGRIGVATGEVVTGTQERLATGDAVNVAARLEQAARAGEVLIGEETLRLTRDAVDVEALEPLALKGKSVPVPAYRLLSIRPGATAIVRHLEGVMVGRSDELDLLRRAYARSVRERSCYLFTVLGPAGVGKSRLAAEALGSLDGPLVVEGRCLPYGDGITYWPALEVIKQLPEVALDDVAAERIQGLIGEKDVVTSSEEIAWSFRKLLEAVAREQPLVCVFDDVHWGEEAFLDLIEHVADLSRDAPILLLCLSRPELLDRRPGWAGGKINATSVLLEPLGPEETDELIESLAEIGQELRARISAAAEGNPLFVEEMVAMVRESSERDVVVPPTIQALLAARLDQLSGPERGVLQRGAIEGRTFHRGAVQALGPEEAEVGTRLIALVRKELVRPDEAQLPGEDAFRFRHLLIRDAAYDALPKAIRAELHERFAAWLAEHGRDLLELDEMLGYHLEQAHRYKTELAEQDPELAERAGEHLAAAGARADARGDFQATAALLRRATALLADGGGERPQLLLTLGRALAQGGELVEADAVLAEAVEAADRVECQALRHQALLERLGLALHVSSSTGSVEELEQAIERAIPVFETEGDELGLTRAYRWQAEVHNFQGRTDDRMQALEEALRHAQLAANAVEVDETINYLAGVLVISSTPADEVIERCRALLARSATRPIARASLTANLAHLHARRGEFDQARELMASAQDTAREFGLRWIEARFAEPAGWIALLEGDPEAAEREFRHGYELFEAMGERGRRATTTAWLAAAVYAQGRLEEAERLVTIADELGHDRYPAVRAKVLARRGELAEAEALAREAAELARRYQSLYTPWLLDAAEVLHAAGREHEAGKLIEEALVTFEQSGNLVMAKRARSQLAELQAGSGTATMESAGQQ
jgi:class 3 adenylate cyclase/predicted ATPase